MKITFSLDELNAVVQKMGASPSSWVVGSKVLSERATLLGGLEKGINIALSDVDVGPGNLLIYKDEQVILYIKDTQDSKEQLKYSQTLMLNPILNKFTNHIIMTLFYHNDILIISSNI